MCDKTSNIRLYLDSAYEKEWQQYLPKGLFYGVTTNPKLLRKSGIDFSIRQLEKLANTAFKLGAQEIHIQVWGGEREKMFKVGRELANIDPRVIVKVPITSVGIMCAKELIAEGANITLTALHSAQQSIIAIALNANYAAPYLGRMMENGINGIEEVNTMQKIVNAMNSSLRLLVASIRQVSDLVTLASCGLNTFTLRPSIIDNIIKNDLTKLAFESFENAVQQD